MSGQSIRREKRAAHNLRTFTVDVKKTLHNGCTKGVCARVGAAAKISRRGSLQIELAKLRETQMAVNTSSARDISPNPGELKPVSVRLKKGSSARRVSTGPLDTAGRRFV